MFTISAILFKGLQPIVLERLKEKKWKEGNGKSANYELLISFSFSLSLSLFFGPWH